MKFQFGNVVVVDDDQIGVIVKSWLTLKPWNGDAYNSYDIYVRSYNNINEYAESNIKHFVYSKHLAEDEHAYYE